VDIPPLLYVLPRLARGVRQPGLLLGRWGSLRLWGELFQSFLAVQDAVIPNEVCGVRNPSVLLVTL